MKKVEQISTLIAGLIAYRISHSGNQSGISDKRLIWRKTSFLNSALKAPRHNVSLIFDLKTSTNEPEAYGSCKSLVI